MPVWDTGIIGGCFTHYSTTLALKYLASYRSLPTRDLVHHPNLTDEKIKAQGSEGVSAVYTALQKLIYDAAPDALHGSVPCDTEGEPAMGSRHRSQHSFLKEIKYLEHLNM